MTEVFDDSEQARVSAYLGQFNTMLAVYYDLPQMMQHGSKITIGHVNEECLERVTERKYAAEIVEGDYVLNSADCETFVEELEYVLEDVVYSPDLGTKLFVGLGVAGTAALEAFSQVKRNINPLKAKPHYEVVSQFFESPKDIDEVFQSLFIDRVETDGGTGTKLAMTENLHTTKAGAERVDAINGLRLRFHTLLGVPEVREALGISNSTLTRAAQQQIRKIYDRDQEDYNDWAKRFGHSDKAADKMFFDALPDWLIAAATPIRDPQLAPIFSKAWQY